MLQLETGKHYITSAKDIVGPLEWQMIDDEDLYPFFWEGECWTENGKWSIDEDCPASWDIIREATPEEIASGESYIE